MIAFRSQKYQQRNNQCMTSKFYIRHISLFHLIVNRLHITQMALDETQKMFNISNILFFSL